MITPPLRSGRTSSPHYSWWIVVPLIVGAVLVGMATGSGQASAQRPTAPQPRRTPRAVAISAAHSREAPLL
ncbi:MAG: hypothetical protein OWS74_03000, partial [Firmicutes bacterium]|nr:hypothetical protein [Bacillota bacterium]